MRLITFSPVTTGIAIRASVDPSDARYRERIAALRELSGSVRVPAVQQDDARSSYEDLSSDDADLRLCVLEPRPQDESASLRIHVFPGAYAIAEYEFDPPQAPEDLEASAIEKHALTQSRRAIEAARPALRKLVANLRASLPADWLESQSDEDPSIAWTARTIVLEPEEVATHEVLINHWLANTARPKDAQALRSGEKDYSMTWLNYVVATDDPRRLALLSSAMRISQFFYARQNAINERARHALAEAFSTTDIRRAQELLASARSDIQLLRIQYDTLSSLLNRNKRRIIEGIMEVWDYPRLVNNGQRMVEASTSRIQEITAQRAERSSFVTDLILTVITFLAVIDVLLTLSQYSREVMSRPVLEYQDRDLSWILSSVASVDTDRVLIGGALSVITLLLLYAYWKLRK